VFSSFLSQTQCQYVCVVDSVNVCLSVCLCVCVLGSANGLLLATDVASRGLDIPGVQHVIHYQVPRTTEVGEPCLSVTWRCVCDMDMTWYTESYRNLTLVAFGRCLVYQVT